MIPQAQDSTPQVSAEAQALPADLRSYNSAFLLKAAEIVLDSQNLFWKSAGHKSATDNTMMSLHLNDENCSQPIVWMAVADILREGAKMAGDKTVNINIDETSANFVVPSAAIRSARQLCEGMKKSFGSQDTIP